MNILLNGDFFQFPFLGFNLQKILPEFFLENFKI